MRDAVQAACADADLLVMAAAVNVQQARSKTATATAVQTSGLQMGIAMTAPIHGTVFRSISTVMNSIVTVAIAPIAAVVADAQLVKLKIVMATVVQIIGLQTATVTMARMCGMASQST